MRPYSFSKPKIRRLSGLGSSIGVDTEYQQTLSSTTEGTSRRMLKKFVSKAAGESKPEAYSQGYVEDFDEPRTKLAGFFSILLSGEEGLGIGWRQPSKPSPLAGAVEDCDFQGLQRELLVSDLFERGDTEG